ncbi:MAG: T9SS type A sorting domain-containing protein [Bacteroidia bacterium]
MQHLKTLVPLKYMRPIISLIILCSAFQLFAAKTNTTTHDTCHNIIEVWPDSVACEGDSIKLEAKGGFTVYEWFDGNRDSIRWVKETGWYELETETPGGTTCYDSIYIVIHETEELKYFTNKDPYLCRGDSIVVELTSGFKNYWWSTGHRYDRAVLSPTGDSTIVVEVEDSNGCEQRIEFTIYVDECDSCDILEHDEIVKCDKDSVALEAEHGWSDYEWGDGTEGRLKWAKETGWYTVKAKNANGYWCEDSVYVELHEGKELEAFFSKSPYLCIGDSIVIELTSGFKEYWWSTGHRYDRAVLYPTTDTIIVIEAVDSNGCEQRLMITIGVDECDSCNILGLEEISKCDEDSIVLEANYGWTDYEWDDGTEGRILWVKESGWYKIKAKTYDGYWCEDSIYVELNEAKELNAYTNPSPAKICIGDSVVIELTGGFAEYWWSSGHRYDRAVIYPTKDTVIVVEAVDSNGCDQRIEIEIEVDSCTLGVLPSILNQDIKHYPNPFRNSINIEVKSPLDDMRLQILNIQGKIVHEEQLELGVNTIDLSNLTNTMFFIKIGRYYGRALKQG